jgi:hypothetical protein
MEVQMDKSDGQLLPALAGLTLAAMLIIAFALDFAIIGMTGGQPGFDLQNIGDDLLRAQGSGIWRVEAWLYLLMVVPFVVFAFGVYHDIHAQSDAGLPALGLSALTLFWIFSTIHNAAIVTVLQVLVPGYRSGAADGPGLEAAARALLGLGDTIFVPGGGVGSLFLVIGIASLGQSTLRSRRLPRWTGFVALACALLSLLGYLQYLARPFFFVGLLGFVLYIIWQTAVSLSLLRQRAAIAPDYAAAAASRVTDFPR